MREVLAGLISMDSQGKESLPRQSRDQKGALTNHRTAGRGVQECQAPLGEEM